MSFSKPEDETAAAENRRVLANCRVVVTRARAQAAEMTALLEDAGATVTHFPMIETVAPKSWERLDAAIARLGEYDWLLFTSVNGVQFFFRRLSQRTGEALSALTAARLCAIGEATAQALEEAGCPATLIAADAKAEGLLAAFIEHLGGEAAVRGCRLLIPRARLAREVLPAELARLGAVVDAVEAYQTIKPEVDEARLRQMLASRAIDVITFTSSSTVHNFIASIGGASAASLLQDVRLACIGPVTARTAAAYGLQNLIQPKVYTAAALVNAICQAVGSD